MAALYLIKVFRAIHFNIRYKNILATDIFLDFSKEILISVNFKYDRVGTNFNFQKKEVTD